jgi:hypothetical protein
MVDDDLQRLSRLATGSEHTTGSSASSRRPRRGVARTKSMDTDVETSAGSRPRDASTTRTRRPPRTTNSSGELRPPRGHESMGDFSRQAELSISELSTRSGPDDSKPLSRSSGRRSPRVEDDILPSNSRSGRSRTTDDAAAKQSERARSVGSKAGKDPGKPPPKSRSPVRDVQTSSRMPRRGSTRGSGDTRTPSPPGAESRLRRGSRARSPSEVIPPRATRSPRPNKPISGRNDSRKMEELGRLLSGS